MSYESPQTQYNVGEQFEVSATVTIDERGVARVVIHSQLGRSLGDSIPLWSVTEDRQIGKMTISSGVIKNGHTII
jgi:hypothetical protein